MGLSEWFFSAAEIIGVAAASISGSIIAIKSSLDLFGIIFCAVLTSLGGGAVRDILINELPPRSFYNYIFLLVAFVSSLSVYIVYRIVSKRRDPKNEHLHKLFLFFDAVGLASFTVSGVQIGMNSGHAENGFLCVFLGMTTAVGGGIMRDLMTARVPMVMHEDIYATASIIGGIICYTCLRFGVNGALSVSLSMFIIVLIRLLAVKFHWSLPKSYGNFEF